MTKTLVSKRDKGKEKRKLAMSLKSTAHGVEDINHTVPDNLY